MEFCSGGEKMTIAAVTGVKMRDNDISSIKRVSRKFPEVPRCSRTKRWQRNVQKRCAARAKLLFCQLGPILVFFFYRFRCHRHLALHDFIFCLSKL